MLGLTAPPRRAAAVRTTSLRGRSACRRAAAARGRRSRAPAGRASRAGRRARGCGRSRTSSESTVRPFSLSRLPVGSSASSRRGSVGSARATATRWRSPVDSFDAVTRCLRPIPTRSSHGCALRCASRRAEPRPSSLTVALSSAPLRRSGGRTGRRTRRRACDTRPPRARSGARCRARRSARAPLSGCRIPAATGAAASSCRSRSGRRARRAHRARW